MTGGTLHTKTDERLCRLNTPQLLFFTSAMILLSALNFSGSSVESKRPAVLLAGAVFTLFNFQKSSRISVIAKITLLYIIEILFNQLSGRFIHIGAFSIHLSLAAMAALAVSFMFCKFQKPNTCSAETADLLRSWAIVFAVIILHMLLLFVPLKDIYGFGYDHNFDVIANMCLYFLVFIFSWEQLENIRLRRITAMTSAVCFIVIIVRGL